MSDIEFSPERSAAIRRLLVAEVNGAPVRAERSTSRISLFAATGTLLLIAVLIVIGGSMGSVRATVASLLHPSSGAGASSSADVSPTVRPTALPTGAPETGFAGGTEAGPLVVGAAGVNGRGESYGPPIAGRGLPQLVAVVGRAADGRAVSGYVARSDYVGAPVNTTVPLLRADGTTVVGTWTVTRRG
ncbi:MAG: hypothetical protein JWP75_3439 [Frondihabitans sp.]|nr:hypothetical protein [Frondihabitans sp.]